METAIVTGADSDGAAGGNCEIILFLCLSAASYVTAAELSVDGGWAAFGDAGLAWHGAA